MSWARCTAALSLVCVLSACATQSGGAPAAAPPAPCQAVYTVLHTAPSDIAAAAQEGRCVPENLRFSGELSGAVHDAYLNPETGVAGATPGVVCKPPGRGEPYPMALLDIDLRGKAYRLEVAPPGKFDRAKTSFTSGLDSAVELASVTGPRFDWKGVSGELTEDARGTQGSLDLSLIRDVQGAAPVHMRGTWTCAKPAPPASIPSDPCQQILAAQGLPPATIGLEPANPGLQPPTPCLDEDLTFTGAVSGHATHAIKDLREVGGSNTGEDQFPRGVPYEPLVPQCGTDDLTKPTAYGSQFDVALGGEGYRVLLSDWYDTFAEQAIKLPDFTAINGADPLMSGADVVPTVILHTGTDIWSSTSGSWHVNPDLHSGTVDVELNGGVSGDQIVHMSGNWRCDGA